MNVAFLGLGRMGRAMAAHLAHAGHRLSVWNRSPGKAGALTALGARETGSIAEAVRSADAVVLMLFGPDAVRSVLVDVLAAAPAGALVLDASTTGPEAAREFGARCAAAGLRFVDAPVTGSVGPAQSGTLGVLVGASEADFLAVRPLLTLWGDPDRITLAGPVGSGNALKLVVNLALGVAMAGLGEALRLGHDLGLAFPALDTALAPGPLGWTLAQKHEMIMSGDFSATSFSLELMAKDLQLCLADARRELPATAATLRQCQEAVTAGHGADDYAALAGWLASEGNLNSC